MSYFFFNNHILLLFLLLITTYLHTGFVALLQVNEVQFRIRYLAFDLAQCFWNGRHLAQ